MLLLAAAVVAISPSLVRLSIATGVLNALLLPLVLCFLYRLARSELPPACDCKGRMPWWWRYCLFWLVGWACLPVSPVRWLPEAAGPIAMERL
jgi:hypothetical protein